MHIRSPTVAEEGDYQVVLKYRKLSLITLTTLNIKIFNMFPTFDTIADSFELYSLRSPPVFEYSSPPFVDPENNSLQFTFSGIDGQSVILT